MSTSQILDRAADHIEKYGWARKEYFRPEIPDGPNLPPNQCPVCADAAISVAAGQHPEFSEGLTLDFIDDPTDAEELGPEHRDALQQVRAAETAFARHLRRKYGGELTSEVADQVTITTWNDEPGRTAEQVIAELRACALTEREAGR